MQVPEGWKLVPVERTPEMVREGNIDELWWKKMLAAAPTPPAEAAAPRASVAAVGALQATPVAVVCNIYGDPAAFAERELRALVDIQTLAIGTRLYAAPQPAAQQSADRFAPLQALVERHAAELEANPYAYFELAYTRRTDWMAWICSKSIDDDPDRKVIARGQGSTPEEACQRAIESLAPARADGATPEGGA